MKKIYFICILGICITGHTYSQTSWIGVTSTNWNTATNWTSGVPSATVDVIIGDANFTGGFQPKLTATSVCKSLTIGSGAILSTLTIAKNITVSGNITIGANGTILHNVANTTITLKGNWTKTGTYTASLTTNQITFSGTAQILTGATTFKKLTVNFGSTLTLASNIIVNTSLSISGTLNPTSAYIVSGIGTLTVNSGGVILVYAADFTSNYTISGTITLNGTSTVNYAASTSNQNITNSLTYGYLRVSGGMVKTLTGNLPTLTSTSANSGRIYIDAGVLDLQTYTANRGTTVTGGFIIIANGAFLKIGGTNTFPSNYNTITIASNATVEYSGTNQTVLATSYGNLTLSSSSGSVIKTMPASVLTIAGNLISSISTGTSVSFTAGNNITVNRDVSLGASTTFDASSFQHTFKGNWINNGTITGSTSTVTLSGVNAVVSGVGVNNFNNLTFSGVGATGASSTSINIAGNLSTTGAGSFTHASNGIVSMTGTAKTILGNGFTFSNLNISGNITTAANIKIAGNFTVNGVFAASNGTSTFNGSSKTLAGSGTITFFALNILGTISTANSFTMLSNLSVAVGAALTTTAGIVTMNGNTSFSGIANLFNVTINAAKTLVMGTNSVLGIANTFIKTGTLNVTSNIPNTVEYNSFGAQSIVNTTYNNLTLSNGGVKTVAGAITVNRDFTINPSVTFNASSFIFSLYRHWINNGIFTASTSDVQLRGANAADVTGVSTFYKLTVNKNSTVLWVTLLSNITVTNNLTMTQGNMQTGSYSVTITGTRLGTGTGVIIGTITQNHTFTNGAIYYFEGPDNRIVFTSPSAGLTSVTVKITLGAIADFDATRECILREYEIIIPAGTYTNATLRLHYQDNELNAFDEPNLAEFKFNSGTTWDSIGRTTLNSTTNYVEKTAIVTIAGRWTLSGVRNTVRWNGSVSSAWETAANWTTVSGSNMSNRVPTSTDAAEIGQASFTNSPIITSTQTVNVLRYGSIQGSTLTIGSGSLTTIGSIKGLWSAAASHTLDVAAGSLIVGTNLDLCDGTVGHDILLKIGTGSATVNFNLTQNLTGGVNFTGNGTLTIGGLYNYTAGSFTAGSGTVIYTGTEAQIVAPVTYNNLTFTKSTETAVINAPTIVNGNLITSIGGELMVSNTLTVLGNITIGVGNEFSENGILINVGGNWTNNGTFTVSNGSVNFNGTGNQSVNTNIFNTLIVNKSGGTLLLTGDLVINSNLTLTSGILDLSTFTANRSNTGGVITLGATSLLKTAGVGNFPGNFISTLLDATSTVEYNGAIAQNVTDIDYGNLTFSNGGASAKALQGDVQVNGDLLINLGATLDPGANKITLYGNFTNSGTYIPATSTLILNGTSKIFAGNTTLNNLTTITGTYSVTSSVLTVAGDMFCDTTASINFGSVDVTLDGDFTNKGTLISNGILTFSGTRLQTFQLIGAIISASTGIVNFNGSVTPISNSVNSTVSFYTVNWNNTGTGSYVISSPWTVVKAINIATGTTLDFGSLTHNFYGNFTNNGTVTSSGVLNFTPHPAYTSAATVILDVVGGSFSSTGTVNFGSITTTPTLTIVDNTPTFNNVNITNKNAAGITPPNDWTIGQNLYIESGAIFNAGIGLGHTIAGSITNNGTLNGNTSTITFTGNPAFIDGVGTALYHNFTVAAGANLTLNKSIGIDGNLVVDGNFVDVGRTVTFSGTGNSTISGAAGIVTFDDLDQNKTNATTTFLVPVTITNELTLIDGIINTTSTNILTVNDNASSTSGSPTCFVNGPMKKIGDEPFVFPVGKSGTPNIWARIEMINDVSFQNFDSTTVFTCEYFKSTPVFYNNPSKMGTGVYSVSAIEYWNLDRTFDSGNNAQCNIALYWEDASRSGITGNSDLFVAHYDISGTTKWEKQGGTGIGGASGYVISSIPVSSFSPFTFGTEAGVNPLPIELLSFAVQIENNEYIKTSWVTASETNNDYFSLERSTDGIHFVTVGTIPSNANGGNSTFQLSYTFIDSDKAPGVYYYRLKQTDFDGKFKYSSIITAELNNSNSFFEFDVYPNPTNGLTVNSKITSNHNDKVLIVVVDIFGQELYSNMVILNKEGENIYAIDPQQKLKSGIYTITAVSNNNYYSKRLVVN
jgi:hypothetical protein